MQTTRKSGMINKSKGNSGMINDNSKGNNNNKIRYTSTQIYSGIDFTTLYKRSIIWYRIL